MLLCDGICDGSLGELARESFQISLNKTKLLTTFNGSILKNLLFSEIFVDVSKVLSFLNSQEIF